MPVSISGRSVGQRDSIAPKMSATRQPYSWMRVCAVLATLCAVCLPPVASNNTTETTTKVYPRMILPEGSNSYILGFRKEGDSLLETIKCTRPKQLNGTFQEIFTYPNKKHPAQGKEISCIQVNDPDTTGQGPWTSITAGGLGHKDVTLTVSSAPGGGMNVSIEIYGV